jgi:dienelactone hydrolase
VAVGLALVVLATACSGGGGHASSGPTTSDVIDQAGTAGDRAVEFPGAGKVHISGTLSVPVHAGNASMPGVLFVPTLGPGTRDGPLSTTNVLDPIATDVGRAFLSAGMVTLRYDRRGTGQSKLDPGTQLSFDDMVADAKAGLDLLSQRKETSGSKLAVVAYDEGSLVALRLAATDPRVSRVVLISPPGRPEVEIQASRLNASYGAESADALRSTVATMIAGGTLPPLEDMRTELRPLLPADEIPFLTQVYDIDPVAEASRVQAPVFIAVGSQSSGSTPDDANRLQQALGGRAQVDVGANDDESLSAVLPPPAFDPSDPSSPMHEHGAGPPSTTGNRDATVLNAMASWLATGLGAHPA